MLNIIKIFTLYKHTKMYTNRTSSTEIIMTILSLSPFQRPFYRWTWLNQFYWS